MSRMRTCSRGGGSRERFTFNPITTMENEEEKEKDNDGFESSVVLDEAIAEFASDATPVGDLYRSAVNAIGVVVTEAKVSCGMGRGNTFRFGHIVGEALAGEYVDASDAYIKAAGRYAKHLVTMAMSLPYWKTMGDKARRDIGDACDIAAREMAAARVAFNGVKRKLTDVMDAAEAAAMENPVRMVVGVNGETENPPAEPDGEAGEE